MHLYKSKNDAILDKYDDLASLQELKAIKECLLLWHVVKK